MIFFGIIMKAKSLYNIIYGTNDLKNFQNALKIRTNIKLQNSSSQD